MQSKTPTKVEPFKLSKDMQDFLSLEKELWSLPGLKSSIASLPDFDSVDEIATRRH